MALTKVSLPMIEGMPSTISDGITDDTPSLVSMASSLDGTEARPILIIPPNTLYDYSALMADAAVPETTIVFDLSGLGGYNSGTYEQGVVGFYDKGTSDSSIDTNFVISSGHNPSLRLENTGKSGSPSGLARGALINYGAGRYEKGALLKAQKTIGRLAFGRSQSDTGTNWQLSLRALAPWEAVITEWFRWATGVTDVAIADYCFSDSKWYKATTSGTTGTTAPTHTSGTASDGGVSWERIYYGNDSGVLLIDDLGRISTNGTRGTNSYRFKQSPYATDTAHKFLIEATAEANGTDNDKAVALYFAPTDAAGVVTDVPHFSADAVNMLRLISTLGSSLAKFTDTGATLYKTTAISGVIKTSSTAANGDTTPTVADIGTLVLNNTGATSITLFDDGEPNQEVTLIARTGNTTLIHSSSMYLAGSANITLTTNSILTIRRTNYDSSWREVSRSIV